MTTPPAPNAPRPLPLNIEVPPELEAIYSNFALITHSPSEFILDFARVLPKATHHKVYARILMTPLHAKLLLRALAENVAKYEAQFGEIATPEGSGLAEQLFRPRPQE